MGEGGIAGAGCEGAGSTRGWPHLLQNLLPSGFVCPHCGQTNSDWSNVPHPLQNFAPSGLSCPQPGHFTVKAPYTAIVAEVYGYRRRLSSGIEKGIKFLSNYG